MSAEDQKRLAGEAAALRVEAGMVVGLGTGSTAAWFVKALAARGLKDLRCVPTSEKTADLARELGLDRRLDHTHRQTKRVVVMIQPPENPFHAELRKGIEAARKLIADGTVGKISQKYFQEDVTCK